MCKKKKTCKVLIYRDFLCFAILSSGETGTIIYYPIIVNKSQTGTNITGASGTGTSNIARNTTYAIKATIKNIGTDDPTGEINPTSLELTVSVADWALNITQDVTFE